MESSVRKGDGYAVAHLDELGEGWGFRKVRKELGVEAFGVNAIVMPPGYESGRHYHEEQEELYFVHQGRLEINLDGTKHELAPGAFARVAPQVVRSLKNLSDSEDAIYICVGGKDGYVGRDGKLPEDETDPRGPIKEDS
ncbi:MAG TPA: cupin domain-containing protein [Solirubrobacterales bacterium]|nr:cupin domain-containing protein [Solirubrobacterales bacterium]